MFTDKKTCIISLGGSIIVPDNVDWEYLISFRDMITAQIEKGWKFIIITGGGKTARRYIEAIERADPDVPDADKDWLGIHATRLNAHCVRALFRSVAHPRINTNPNDLEDFYHSDKSVYIAAGWRPGFSTDYDATLLAKYLDVPRIANFSNTDYVYDSDPKKNPDAKKIERITWEDFRKLVGSSWEPGLNAPFDPVASKLAQVIGLEVAVMNGRDIENFRLYLAGESFKGTLITN